MESAPQPTPDVASPLPEHDRPLGEWDTKANDIITFKLGTVDMHSPLVPSLSFQYLFLRGVHARARAHTLTQ
jgi:hypothetical protein